MLPSSRFFLDMQVVMLISGQILFDVIVEVIIIVVANSIITALFIQTCSQCCKTALFVKLVLQTIALLAAPVAFSKLKSWFILSFKFLEKILSFRKMTLSFIVVYLKLLLRWKLSEGKRLNLLCPSSSWSRWTLCFTMPTCHETF